VISVLGAAQVKGQKVFVHITVVVPPGANANQAALAALKEQGARPLRSDEFSTTGLVWDQYFDIEPDNDSVLQHYNPANDPTGGGGKSALLNTHITWTGVNSSRFAFNDGIDTDRCPSLVKECEGSQYFDGYNDVAWLQLRSRNTLGVTWYSTSIDEADMALNTKFSWSTDADGVNDYDVETVFLHENGHVLGLGHSNVPTAVMYAYYGGERLVLDQDDIDGITSLYPTGSVTDPPTVSITAPADGSTFASGATATIDFAGTAIDTEDGDLAADLAWKSDMDGQIGTGGSFSTIALSDGNHTITAEVTDLDGATGSDSISITVGTPPAEATTVSVSAITYATEGGKKGDKHLLITVALVDYLEVAVAGESVSIDLYRDGTRIASGTGTTGTDGKVTWTLKNARSGDYKTTVTDVTAAGLTWDGVTPENNFKK
jgi:predicted secreted protein